MSARSRIARGVAGALVVVALSSGCSSYINYDYGKEFDPRKHEYVIGPADGLTINVWQNGDLSTQAIVRPDGTITMPLVGDLKVAGKTPSQVRDEIKTAITQYVKAEAAIVTVAVTAVNSYRFTVTGNVTNPGSFQSQYYVSIAEALAMAGGPSRFADTSSIEVIRVGRDGKLRRIPVNFDDIETRKRPEANVILVAGDTIFVP
ncbi:MAG: polysaccharide transporter [Polyangiaceae bacterium]|nr:polysaccharide transporter [Polyangiaceae bacterium]